MSLGALAFAGLTDPQREAKSRMHAPRCKSVIYLHMEGSPSPLDMFDPKPELVRFDGKKCPDEFLQKARFAFMKGHPKLLAPRYPFEKKGRMGLDVVSLLPHLGQVVDDLCVVKSMHTDQFNHAPAEFLMFTGSPRIGRPAPINCGTNWFESARAVSNLSN